MEEPVRMTINLSSSIKQSGISAASNTLNSILTNLDTTMCGMPQDEKAINEALKRNYSTFTVIVANINTYLEVLRQVTGTLNVVHESFMEFFKPNSVLKQKFCSTLKDQRDMWDYFQRELNGTQKYLEDSICMELFQSANNFDDQGRLGVLNEVMETGPWIFEKTLENFFLKHKVFHEQSCQVHGYLSEIIKSCKAEITKTYQKGWWAKCLEQSRHSFELYKPDTGECNELYKPDTGESNELYKPDTGESNELYKPDTGECNELYKPDTRKSFEINRTTTLHANSNEQSITQQKHFPQMQSTFQSPVETSPLVLKSSRHSEGFKNETVLYTPGSSQSQKIRNDYPGRSQFDSTGIDSQGRPQFDSIAFSSPGRPQFDPTAFSSPGRPQFESTGIDSQPHFDSIGFSSPGRPQFDPTAFSSPGRPQFESTGIDSQPHFDPTAFSSPGRPQFESSGIDSPGRLKLETTSVSSSGRPRYESPGIDSPGRLKLETTSVGSSGRPRYESPGIDSPGRLKLETTSVGSSGRPRYESPGIDSPGRLKLETTSVGSSGRPRYESPGIDSPGRLKLETTSVGSSGRPRYESPGIDSPGRLKLETTSVGSSGRPRYESPGIDSPGRLKLETTSVGSSGRPRYESPGIDSPGRLKLETTSVGSSGRPRYESPGIDSPGRLKLETTSVASSGRPRYESPGIDSPGRLKLETTSVGSSGRPRYESPGIDSPGRPQFQTSGISSLKSPQFQSTTTHSAGQTDKKMLTCSTERQVHQSVTFGSLEKPVFQSEALQPEAMSYAEKPAYQTIDFSRSPMLQSTAMNYFGNATYQPQPMAAMSQQFIMTPNTAFYSTEKGPQNAKVTSLQQSTRNTEQNETSAPPSPVSSMPQQYPRRELLTERPAVQQQQMNTFSKMTNIQNNSFYGRSGVQRPQANVFSERPAAQLHNSMQIPSRLEQSQMSNLSTGIKWNSFGTAACVPAADDSQNVPTDQEKLFPGSQPHLDFNLLPSANLQFNLIKNASKDNSDYAPYQQYPSCDPRNPAFYTRSLLKIGECETTSKLASNATWYPYKPHKHHVSSLQFKVPEEPVPAYQSTHTANLDLPYNIKIPNEGVIYRSFQEAESPDYSNEKKSVGFASGGTDQTEGEILCDPPQRSIKQPLVTSNTLEHYKDSENSRSVSENLNERLKTLMNKKKHGIGNTSSLLQQKDEVLQTIAKLSSEWSYLPSDFESDADGNNIPDPDMVINFTSNAETEKKDRLKVI